MLSACGAMLDHLHGYGWDFWDLWTETGMRMEKEDRSEAVISSGRESPRSPVVWPVFLVGLG